MYAYIANRLVSSIPVLLGISVVVFALAKLIPGDAAQVLAGPSATRDEVESPGWAARCAATWASRSS
jgi:peptide/nickel transport system permease protein